MDLQHCDAFVRQIERHYPYLFDDHGFRIIHRDERANGKYCLVIMESDLARLSMELEPSVALEHIGRLDAPLAWSIDWEQNRKPGWWVVPQVLAFVEGHAARGLLPMEYRERTIDQMMAEHSERLRPHADELFRAFGPSRPKDWWRRYERFRADGRRAVEAQLRAIHPRYKRSLLTRFREWIKYDLLERY